MNAYTDDVNFHGSRLIKITDTNIDGSTIPTVDGRELHAYMGVRRDFTTWVKQRIDKYDFSEGSDFWIFDSPELVNQKSRGGDRRSMAYALTLDMAKELAMVENNAKGREARRYFIDCERRAKEHSAFDGNMNDLSPAILNAIGTMVATCVRDVMQELITEHLPKLIDAKLQHDPQRVAVRHIPALQVALDKGVTKRPRGLVQRLSNALSRHCEAKGIVVLRDVRGTKLFDRNVVHEWLSNGGWARIRERLDEVGGQSHLKLVT